MTLPEGYGKTLLWRRIANGQSGYSANGFKRGGIGGRLRCMDQPRCLRFAGITGDAFYRRKRLTSVLNETARRERS